MKLCILHLLITVFFSNFRFTYAKPPHIITILIDDLGWNDVSFHGSQQIPTPNIDALAYDGVVLNNYYVQPICTPSRASFMTGKYPIRLGLQHDVIYAEAPYGLPPEETILPQYLKELGYSTHGIGKWHLGFHDEQYLPVNRGFDTFFGYWTGKEDFYTHFEEGQGTHGLDLHDNNENARNYTGQYGTDLFNSKAKDIINLHNASNPLFLYLAHQAVHTGNSYTPLQAPLESVRKFSNIEDEERRKFAGMISNLDDSIGDLISTLDEAGMLDNSVIVFSTDNGAAVEGIDQGTGSNWPLRGSKYNMWEGGIRGVSFVWSPLLSISRGTESKQLMHISDWLPTLYSLAGGNETKLTNIDGYNVWPSISWNAPSPRHMILHNIDPNWNVEAIRNDRFKLLKGSVFNGSFDGWFDKEGKKRQNIPFSKDEKLVHKRVYAQLSNKAKVLPILSKLKDESFSGCKASDLDYLISKVGGAKNCRELNSQFLSIFSPTIVRCGKKIKDTCKPLEAPCLFDIFDDPCEYNNLASFKPAVVEELEGYLKKYKDQAVPVRNKPLDPKSNPKFHDYAWVPWMKLL